MTDYKKNSLSLVMRNWHKNIGFLLVGFTIIMCISGMILVFRKADFLKKEKTTELQLAPNLSADELEKAIEIKDFELVSEDNQQIVFENGTYDCTTGAVVYTTKEYPTVLKKMNKLHKPNHKDTFFIATLIYGALLLFLAISALFMYKPSNPAFKKSIIMVAIGIILSLIILFLA